MPHEIEKDLLKCEQALYEMQTKYPELARTAANARYVYDMAWANAVDEIAHRTLVEGQKAPTVSVQEALATKIVAAEMKATRDAEADLDSAKKHIDTLQGILTSVQTRSKLYLAEMNLK